MTATTNAPIRTPTKPKKLAIQLNNQAQYGISSCPAQASAQQVGPSVSTDQLQHYPQFASTLAILPSTQNNSQLMSHYQSTTGVPLLPRPQSAT